MNNEQKHNLTYPISKIIDALYKCRFYDILGSTTWDGKDVVFFSYAGFRFKVQDGMVFGQKDEYCDELNNKIYQAITQTN